MTLAEIESVVEVSSEDSLHPAKNLVTSAIGNNVKKWLCRKKGEKDVYVVFKLKEKADITHITVGNENTSIIEILVGNAGMQEKEYQVLLPTTELQTVQDVRTGRNKNAVHFFTLKDFKSDVAGRQWDRVKVVCNQPYDSHIRFGLSCFVLKSIKEEDSDINENRNNGQEKKTEELPEEDKSKLNEWKENVLQRLLPASSNNSSNKRNDLHQNTFSPNKKKKIDHNSGEAGCSSESINETENGENLHNKKNDKHVEKRVNKKPPPPPQPSPKKKDFSKILEGVRFSMSGYENPLRSHLRNKGLEMGAKYSGDWDSRCTHLVCAFLNTPKFNQVKSQGRGKIVTKEWIEICYDKRRRLPWRRFALDVRERQLPESEEDEEEEEVARSRNPQKKGVDRRRRLPSSSSSSSDTEDEIERVQARKKEIKMEVDEPLPKEKKEIIKKESLKELYDAETDESEHENDVTGGRPDTSDLPLPRLPDFPSHNYFIAKDEKGEYRHQLERYINAFKGNIKEELSDDVEFVITDDAKIGREIMFEHPRIKAVKSDWIWKCNDEDTFVSPDKFLIS